MIFRVHVINRYILFWTQSIPIVTKQVPWLEKACLGMFIFDYVINSTYTKYIVLREVILDMFCSNATRDI